MKNKILLVDDDPLVLKTVLNLLESKGYEVRACKNGVEAVEEFKTERFDLVMVDIRMPEQSGVETIKKIREKERAGNLPATPIIVITGYASEDVPLEAIELEVAGYVLKPFDYDRFLATIEKALSETSRAPSREGEMERICSEMKRLVAGFHNESEREVFENRKLRKLLTQLEDCLTRMEREFVKLA